MLLWVGRRGDGAVPATRMVALARLGEPGGKPSFPRPPGEAGRKRAGGLLFVVESLSPRGARIESNPQPLRSGAMLSFHFTHDHVLPQRSEGFEGVQFFISGSPPLT